MRARVAVAMMATAVLLSGCSGGNETPQSEPTPSATPAPTYDADVTPAVAVLSLVPTDTHAITVTNLAQLRLQLGVTDLDSSSPSAERDDFWARALASTPSLTVGMLRADDAELTSTYDFNEEDVAYEAQLFDDAGEETGWVLGFREGTNMVAVNSAVKAGVGPLDGAQLFASTRVVAMGITTDAEQSWAAEDDLRALINADGDPAAATYVSRGCLGPPEVSISGTEAITGLDDFSLTFGTMLATARLGADRSDLFERLGLDQKIPEFAQTFESGTADPTTGRLGYAMASPHRAAVLTLQQRLPFAVCA